MKNSIGKRLMPIYLVKFLLSIYDGPEVPNFGARMVSRSFIAYIDSLYKLFGGKTPTDYGRRLVPEYLIKWIEDADYIEFIDDDIAYIKYVPEKALKFAILSKIGGMSYKSDTIVNSIVTSLEIVGNNLYSYEQNRTITVRNFLYSGFKLLDNFKSGVPYTLSFDYEQISGDEHSYYLTIGYGNDSYAVDSNLGITSLRNGKIIVTFTPNNNVYKNLFIRLPRQIFAFSGVFNVNNINLNIGTEALPFQPYHSKSIEINNEISSLEGYGFGINENCYNFVNFEDKVFVKKVSRIDLGSLTWNKTSNEFISNAIIDFKVQGANLSSIDYALEEESSTVKVSFPYSLFPEYAEMTIEEFANYLSGIYLYYELKETQVIDISDYLINFNNIIEINPNGLIKFNNSETNEVPSSISFIIPNQE